MCGIAGLFHYRSAQPVPAAWIQAMTDEVTYRGPDDSGLYCQGAIGLGHRRLSILDLSTAGHQPMCDQTGRYWLVFNGEIYNYVELRSELMQHGYRFGSQSDSEVILAAYDRWGTECLQHFNGMFAFAIWDNHRQELFLARDRLGVKPLYLVEIAGGLAFASEVKSLLQLPGVRAEANPPAILTYMTSPQRCVPTEKTFFQGIRKLLPGHFLHMQLGGEVRIQRYWDLTQVEVREEPLERQVERVRDLLFDAVRLRLRSDVPLGFHLSGGLDSSAIVGIAHQLGVPIHTFSGAFTEGPQYNETPFIRLMAEAVGADHREIFPRAAEIPAAIERIVWFLDEPVVGPGVIPQFFVNDLVASAGIKVVLGGQGSDEIFAGYGRKYSANYFRDWFRPERGQRPWLNPMELGINAWYIVNQSGLRGSVELIRRRLRYRQITSSVFTTDFLATARQGEPALPVTGPMRSRLEKELVYDTLNYLPGLLQVEDRTSMSHSIESRTPFLDYRLVEYAHSIPASRRLHNLTGKYVLRRALEGVLPDAIVNRRDKKGFPTPIGEWFRGPLREWCREVLLSHEARSRGVFQPDRVEALLAAHAGGAADHGALIWTLLNIELWYRTFVDGRVDVTGRSVASL